MIYNKYKAMKTCGVIEEDVQNGIQKVRWFCVCFKTQRC